MANNKQADPAESLTDAEDQNAEAEANRKLGAAFLKAFGNAACRAARATDSSRVSGIPTNARGAAVVMVLISTYDRRTNACS